MKRCPKCDKSDHSHCKRGVCECPCQDYFKEKWNEKLQTFDLTNPVHDKFYADMNSQWREIQAAKKPKTRT